MQVEFALRRVLPSTTSSKSVRPMSLRVADAEAGEDLARFLGDEAEVVLDLLGVADVMLAAQQGVLRGDAGGAVVEVADTQVLAAHGNHRPGAETETLGAENRRLDHVEAGLEAAVGLDTHLAAQLVGAQHLVGFGQAEFPGRARVLDRGQRARAGAAVVTGDRDQIGISLGHAGGDGADAGLGDELDRYQRLGIDLLQIEDQLGEILDRVDVVVRRRRNQRDAGLGMAQSSRSSR